MLRSAARPHERNFIPAEAIRARPGASRSIRLLRNTLPEALAGADEFSQRLLRQPARLPGGLEHLHKADFQVDQGHLFIRETEKVLGRCSLFRFCGFIIAPDTLAVSDRAACRGDKDSQADEAVVALHAMRLPNAEQAIVGEAKLREYCLSESHPRGRHKARLFAAALGLTVANTDLLRTALLDAAHNADAVPTQRNAFGQRYEIRFPMTGPGGSCDLLSAWIVPDGDGIPRLVTCYPV